MHLCLKCGKEIVTDDWRCLGCQWEPLIMNNYLTFAPELALQNQHFNSDDFDFFVNLESKHFWFRARNVLIQWALKKYFTNAKTFLEVGCGTGFVLANVQKHCPNLVVEGSDIYSTSLPFAQSRLHGDVKLFQMDARNMPFINKFDIIGAFDVLEHIEEDDMVIKQMYAALKPLGGLVLTVPQHPILWSGADDSACHVRRYEMTELQNKLKNAGFSIKRTSSFVFLLLPLMFISRFAFKHKYNRQRELSPNRIINGVLELILLLEVVLIKIGLSLPFGGTRFIVAIKE